MKPASKLGIILIAVTSFGFLVAGCSVTYRAKIYPIPTYLGVNEFQGQGEAVSIKNEAGGGLVPMRTMPGAGISVGEPPELKGYFADLRQVTDVTASLLAEELSMKGFSVRGDALKSITLNVIRIYLLYAALYTMTPSYQCLIEMEYKTSDGYKNIIRASNLTDWYETACNGAITNGVVDLLNDEELTEFLTKRVP